MSLRLLLVLMEIFHSIVVVIELLVGRQRLLLLDGLALVNVDALLALQPGRDRKDFKVLSPELTKNLNSHSHFMANSLLPTSHVL